ncbi:hypothetical protein JW988_09220 [Candidatus Bathyarchaeota archaeon]|nr:hypothetical protein [Candidatus Bathyarchaeota archaeon]
MRVSAVATVVTVFLIASCIMAVPVFSSADAAEDTWVSKARMNQARTGLGVVAVGGKIYAIGGTASNHPSLPDSVLGTNEEYDPATNTWTIKAPMPTPRTKFVIAAYKNQIFCIGGIVGTEQETWGVSNPYKYAVSTQVNEVYNTDTGTWETKTPAPTPVALWQAHVINDNIYVMAMYHTYVYDPLNDAWTEKTKMPTPWYQTEPVSAVIDNKIIVNGEYEVADLQTERRIYIYDPATDNWAKGKSEPPIGGDAAAATLGINAPQLIYFFGVRYPDQAVTQAYDLETDTWTSASPMPTPRHDFGLVVLDDILYAIGGHKPTNSNPTSVNEQYTPIGYSTTPWIKIISPLTHTYNESSVSLVFTVNKPVEWLGYSFDGQDNVTAYGNITLSGLPNGLHNVTVYAMDEFGNTGVSETASFTVAEPFPAVTVAVASAASVAVVVVGLLVYFKKRSR